MPSPVLIIGSSPFFLYSYVRQDQQLWDLLHAGTLTTGYVNAALGFYEKNTAKQLGIKHKDECGHQHLLSAYHRLCQPEYKDSQAHCAPAISLQYAEQHNANMLQKFNAITTESNKKEAASTASQDSKQGGMTVLDEKDKQHKARSMGNQGLPHLRCAWGSIQEPATLYALTHLFPNSVVSEVGLCCIEADAVVPKEWGFSAGSLPPLGASPDGIVTHLDLMLCETVEIKNTCPFGMERSRKGSLKYIVRDRGPRCGVLPEWVPQLQLHMLCAGTNSSLLVSRSATLGMRVFRVHRDDEYLRLMLTIIQRLYERHVKPRQPPPAEAFSRLPEHGLLVRRTIQIASSAEVVLEVEDEEVVPGADMRLLI